MARPLLAILAALCLAAPGAVRAQEAAGGTAVVQGLAADDLLKIRVSASPLGAVMGRLPNGALVRRHECRMVEGYEWCRVAALEGEDLAGWTPGRYLQPLEIEAEAETGTEARLGADTDAGDEAPALPPGLDARFADAPPAPALLPEADATTYLPALREALRSRDAVPTATVTADIPCARYLGQPMTRCTASVARIDEAAADVTVAWPDGGTRLISFRDGAPAASNARDPLRATREGGLNLIRIGASERFEITDAVAFGD